MKNRYICSILLISILMISIIGVGVAQKGNMNDTKANGKTLYNYITKENNYKKWKMWPGTGALYPGTEPHGALLTTYVTNATFSAIEARSDILPYDSIIVKENYMPDKTLAAITVMYKEADYDPSNNDWFWAKYMPNGTIAAEGKVQMCINCHKQPKEKYGNQINDYIFTSNLSVMTTSTPGTATPTVTTPKPIATAIVPTIGKTASPQATPSAPGFEGIIGLIVLVSIYMFRKKY